MAMMETRVARTTSHGNVEPDLPMMGTKVDRSPSVVKDRRKMEGREKRKWRMSAGDEKLMDKEDGEMEKERDWRRKKTTMSVMMMEEAILKKVKRANRLAKYTR